MPNIGWDEQQQAVRDNATDSGVGSVEIIGGNLVPIQATSMNTFLELGAGSSGSFQNGLAYNPDGAGGGVNCVPTTTGYVSLWVPFWGRTFGIRARQSAQTFTVSVDGGDAVVVRDFERYLVKEIRQVNDNHEVAVITHTDLADGVMHYAKVMFGPNATASLIFGYLGEEKYYKKPNPVHVVSASAAVPTSLTAIAPQAGGLTNAMRYISQILYFNTTAAALQVTLMATGNTFTVPANGMFALPFPTPIASTVLSHQGSAAGLTFVAFGGYF